jgi:ADP-heptose:LPS heptosyltransferase
MAETSPSVLVIRLDAIGDALALTPLLEALAERAIPTDLVMTPANAEIFSARAARRVYVASFALRSSTRENLAAIAHFGAQLRGNGYSHVLVATEDPGGYRLARATGASERIGFANGWGKPFKTLWARTQLNRIILRSAGLDPRAPHECEVIFSLGRSLLNGAKPTRDPARLRRLILEEDVPRGERIAFQLTSKWERLGITESGVCAAVRSIAQLGELHAIGSHAEAAYASSVASAAGVALELFETLAPWKRAVASARAIVAPDSGAIHLAGMLGTPAVAVFPPIRDFALQTARWSPWAAPYRLVGASEGWPERAASAAGELLGLSGQRQGSTRR